MRASVLVTVVALAATGCGRPTASPQQDAVGTVSTFLQQCARARPLNAMAELQPAAQHEFVDAGGALAGCSRALRQTGLTARDFATATSELGSFTGEHAVK